MEQLVELEKKVARIIDISNGLRKEKNDLQKRLSELEEQNSQLQSSLMKESNNSASLDKEKEIVKSSIEDLLESLSSLDSVE